MFFSYDHEDGIEFWETAKEAKACADKALDMDRDEAAEGWSEEVTQICWGEVRGRVVETERRTVTPEDNLDCDEVVDYALQDTANAEGHGRRSRTVQPLVGNSGGDE